MSFPSSSAVMSEACLIFTPVNDDYIEDTEQFIFLPAADNELDVFPEGTSDRFSLRIFDDDGIYNFSEYT